MTAKPKAKCGFLVSAKLLFHSLKYDKICILSKKHYIKRDPALNGVSDAYEHLEDTKGKATGLTTPRGLEEVEAPRIFNRHMKVVRQLPREYP